MIHTSPLSHQFGTALLVGTDETLLYTRKAILEQQGFHIAIADPEKAAGCMNQSNFAVVVACHMLKPEEADQLVTAARARPNPPALITFSRHISPEATKHPFDATVWSLDSPATFVSKVHETLRIPQP